MCNDPDQWVSGADRIFRLSRRGFSLFRPHTSLVTSHVLPPEMLMLRGCGHFNDRDVTEVTALALGGLIHQLVA
jgi:hypothetical protein